MRAEKSQGRMQVGKEQIQTTGRLRSLTTSVFSMAVWLAIIASGARETELLYETCHLVVATAL